MPKGIRNPARTALDEFFDAFTRMCPTDRYAALNALPAIDRVIRERVARINGKPETVQELTQEVLYIGVTGPGSQTSEEEA